MILNVGYDMTLRLSNNMITNVGINVTTNVGINMTTHVDMYTTTNVVIDITTNVRMYITTNEDKGTTGTKTPPQTQGRQGPKGPQRPQGTKGTTTKRDHNPFSGDNLSNIHLSRYPFFVVFASLNRISI